MIKLDLSNQNITSLKDVDIPSDVTHIDLSGNIMLDLNDVKFPDSLTYLTLDLGPEDVLYLKNLITQKNLNFSDSFKGLGLRDNEKIDLKKLTFKRINK